MESRNIIVCRDAKSPYWLAQWTGADGRKKRKTTKVPAAGGQYKAETLSKAQAKRRALLVAFEFAKASDAEYNSENNMSVRELFDKMLSGKLGRVSAATYYNARIDYAQFCQWFGKRADEPARLVTKADIMSWVADRRREVRCATTKKGLSAIRSAFTWAVSAELLGKNPCQGVKIPQDTKDEKIVKEAFTRDEVALLIEKLPEDWSAAVRCCVETFGQRLEDVLTLRWEQFDWESRTVMYTTGKTAEVLRQPMSASFCSWARARYERALELGGEYAEYVIPGLAWHTNPSTEFTSLVRMHKIGLAGADAGGRRRTWHSKTFHSLRRYVATQMAESGISEAMAMKLVGQRSAAVHAVYVKPTAAQLEDVAARMPSF